MTTTTPTHRIVCADFTLDTTSLSLARTLAARVDAAKTCAHSHTIEVRTGDEWLPLHTALARAILAAPLNATVDTFDGQLTKVSGGWSAEAAQRADQGADRDTDFAAWKAAIGPHEHALLTSDGRGTGHSWCTCGTGGGTGGGTDGGPVRYERWTTEGRTAHGFACPSCRMIVQVG